jgi:hypothetical protein
MWRKTLDEKVIEILFSMYAARLYPLGHLLFDAPNQIREKELGYDARFQNGCLELYLQFKRTEFNGEEFQLRINKNQHKRLRERYRKNAAFYVAPTIVNPDIGHIQSELVTCPQEILSHYIAIPVHNIELDTNRIRFRLANDSPRLLTELKPSNRTGSSSNITSEMCWINGAELVVDFMYPEDPDPDCEVMGVYPNVSFESTGQYVMLNDRRQIVTIARNTVNRREDMQYRQRLYRYYRSAKYPNSLILWRDLKNYEKYVLNSLILD